MQPKTSAKIDDKELKIIMNSIKSLSASKRRIKNQESNLYLPELVGIKLTNRCNLRCKHCYQWSEFGYHNLLDESGQKDQIDFKLIEKIIEQTKDVKSRLYVWGGEPLVYSEFDRFAELMVKNPREVAICTNGTLIDKHIDSICKMSSGLEILIGLEGFEEENDEIRGKGVFKKAIDNIKKLVELKKQNKFLGKISVHMMINDKMVDKLFAFAEFLEDIGVDMLIICFPWYISSTCANDMDFYFKKNFKFLSEGTENSGNSSWHSFKYKLNPALLDTLKNEIIKINDKVWSYRVRYQPELDFDMISDFVLGNEIEWKKKPKCLALLSRMDVNADGGVSACKFFSEFVVGNIKDNSISEIWNCDSYKKIREINSKELMPICSKCSVLSLHGM